VTQLARYRKRAIEVEAVQLGIDNADQVWKWIRSNGGRADLNSSLSMEPGWTDAFIEIRTLEGIMRANIGDWIIKGVRGEFYPCRADIFAETYERVGR
jgi:hypothetical protein